MSIRAKLTWAFLLVVAVALGLAFAGLNLGIYSTMIGMHQGGMMGGGMMGGSDWVPDDWVGATLRWSLLSTMAAFVVAGLTGLLTAGRITRSLSLLRDAAQNLALRDLSNRVSPQGNDEIADLAHTFNRMCDRLEAEERSRRMLLADVAHELRHPLAVLQGRLDLMQDGKVPIDRAALVPLDDEVGRLTRLVGDLRDLSLAEVGGLSVRLVPVNLAAILEALLDNLQPVAAAKETTLNAQIAPNLPMVEADPDRIRQVLTNLLSNALQFTDRGGKIQVQAWLEEALLHIRICDSGPGIAPADLPHIFDRFYRADPSRSRGTGGSGLGLAIVRSLVELHHGKITVASHPGEGACFTLSLPAVKAV